MEGYELIAVVSGNGNCSKHMLFRSLLPCGVAVKAVHKEPEAATINGEESYTFTDVTTTVYFSSLSEAWQFIGGEIGATL